MSNIPTKMKQIKFCEQKTCKDVLQNMLNNTHLLGQELYDIIMSENNYSPNSSPNPSRQGHIFENVVKILISLKCIENINYTEIYEGQLKKIKKLTNINSLLKVKVAGGGNNCIDIHIVFTIK